MSFTNFASSCSFLTFSQQGGTGSDVISAIPAAIKTKTSLLLGLWASGGDANFANELAALKGAISAYGDGLGPLVAGISVGSEDLYRISPTGLLNKENVGVGPDVLTGYIKQVRSAVAGTPLADAPIGHVDTWTAWVNSSNNAVIDAIDWLGVDAYPYFQSTMSNGIANGASLLNDAIGNSKGASQGKPVWVTETGWPVSGPTSGEAVASPANAKTFWDEAGCPLFGNTNIWWYTLQDAAPTTPNPSFGVIGSTLTTKPIYDLSCDDVATSSSSSSAAASSSTASSSSAASSAVSSAVSSAASSAASSATSSATSSAAPSTNSSSAGSTSSSSSAAGSGSLTKTTSPSTSTSTSTATGKGNITLTTTSRGSATATTTRGSGSSGSSTTTGPATVVTGAASSLSGSAGAALVAVVAAMLAL